MNEEFLKRHARGADVNDGLRERERLMEIWRRACPEAVAEASAVFHPLVPDPDIIFHRPTGREKPEEGCLPHENWLNDLYYVTVRRYPVDAVFGTDGGMIQLGIHANDGTARHDWRDFQAIKNQLAGAECEAFELYPAESRLLDPSNYYTLWCFPGVKKLKIGNTGRFVLEGRNALAPQRAFPEERAG